MMAGSSTLQSEAGYIDARPHLPELTKPLAPHGRTIHWGQNENQPFSGLCRLRPSADISWSLDDLVGAGEQRWWHVEAERLRGLEIDHQLVFCWLLHWQ